MKKRITVCVLMAFFCVEPVFAEVFTYFSYKNVSQAYINFAYEFGNQFLPKVKEYHFKNDYRIKVLEGMARTEYLGVLGEEEAVIGAFVNDKEEPFVWVKVKDLINERKIKEAASQFSDAVISKLKELDKSKDKELDEPDKETRKKIASKGGDEK